eukprot:s4193_g1.t1
MPIGKVRDTNTQPPDECLEVIAPPLPVAEPQPAGEHVPRVRQHKIGVELAGNEEAETPLDALTHVDNECYAVSGGKAIVGDVAVWRGRRFSNVFGLQFSMALLTTLLMLRRKAAGPDDWTAELLSLPDAALDRLTFVLQVIERSMARGTTPLVTLPGGSPQRSRSRDSRKKTRRSRERRDDRRDDRRDERRRDDRSSRSRSGKRRWEPWWWWTFDHLKPSSALISMPWRQSNGVADWCLALQQVDQLSDQRCGVVVYANAIAAQRRSLKWLQAAECLSALGARTLEGNAVTWTAAAGAAAGVWPRSVQMVFGDMRGRSIRPNVITFSSLFSGWPLVQKLLAQMHAWNLRSDVASHNAALKATSAWRLALRSLEEMPQRGLLPNSTSRNLCISLLDHWARALQMAQDLLGYSSGITKCRWSTSARLLLELQEKHLEPDLIAFNATMNSYGHSRWRHAMHSLHSLYQIALRISSGSLLPVLQATWRGTLWLLPWQRAAQAPELTRCMGAAISACVKGDRWAQALRLHSMQCARNSLTYNSAVSACEEGAHWRLALALMAEMQAERLELDVFTFNSAISASEKCTRWKEAIRLFTGCGNVDVLTFASMLKAVRRGATWHLQLSLMEELEPSSVSPNAICCGEAVAICDLSARWRRQRHNSYIGTTEKRRLLEGTHRLGDSRSNTQMCCVSKSCN